MQVPHGIAVVISAPAIFRFTAAVNPERHLQCAKILGADISNAKSDADYAGNLLADEVLQLMDATGVPMGISKLGFSREDIPALVAVRADRATTLHVSTSRDTAPCTLRLSREISHVFACPPLASRERCHKSA